MTLLGPGHGPVGPYTSSSQGDSNTACYATTLPLHIMLVCPKAPLCFLRLKSGSICHFLQRASGRAPCWQCCSVTHIRCAAVQLAGQIRPAGQLPLPVVLLHALLLPALLASRSPASSMPVIHHQGCAHASADKFISASGCSACPENAGWASEVLRGSWMGGPEACAPRSHCKGGL